MVRGSERSQESRSRERRKGIVSGFHRSPCHLSLLTAPPPLPPLTEADGGSEEGKVTWLSSPARLRCLSLLVTLSLTLQKRLCKGLLHRKESLHFNVL